MPKENRILFVDDKAPLLRLATIILGKKCGYDVVTADSGNAAWDYLTSKGLTSEGRIDLVFTDHDMPDGNGSELVRRIRADDRFMGLPLIMASGRPENANTPEITHFMEKPYNIKDLTSCVQKYLPKEL
jgi:two-component system, chemotaxis family, chemotaxis protein CheY